jgi:hypothetical protein
VFLKSPRRKDCLANASLRVIEREVVMRDDPSILGFDRQIPKSVWLFMKIIMVTRMAIMRRMGTFQFSTTRSQYAMFEMQLENGLN